MPDPMQSDRYIWTLGLRSLRAIPTPESVPPVPTEQVKPSTLPSVCSHISGAGRLVMPASVGEVVELVGPDRTIGLARRNLLYEYAGVARIMHRVGIGNGGNEAKIDAAEAQHVLLFLALSLGHDDDRAIATRIADQRQADPGVTGCTFDDDAALAQPATFLGVLDDVKRCAVLYRAAGIEEFGLAEDRAARLLGGSPQFD